MKMYRGFALVLMASAAALLFGCLPEAAAKINEIGRFTSPGKDRIVAVAYQPQMARDDLRFYGKKSLNTSGRSTTVYFYREGRTVPDVLTHAQSLEQASGAIVEANGFSYVFTRATNGLESFVTCPDNPMPDLCYSAVN